MLTITVERTEWFDELTESFCKIPTTTLKLEHSLLSLSKWEAKWNKPFLEGEKTPEETLDYIRCMSTTPNVDPRVYLGLTKKQIEEIVDYVKAPMTATWFSHMTDKPGRMNNEIITSELIYYWMVALQIPFECEKWHLNRLITLVRICNVKNQPPKKTSKRDLLSRYSALNAQRRAKMNSKG